MDQATSSPSGAEKKTPPPRTRTKPSTVIRSANTIGDPRTSTATREIVLPPSHKTYSRGAKIALLASQRNKNPSVTQPITARHWVMISPKPGNTKDPDTSRNNSATETGCSTKHAPERDEPELQRSTEKTTPPDSPETEYLDNATIFKHIWNTLVSPTQRKGDNKPIKRLNKLKTQDLNLLKLLIRTLKIRADRAERQSKGEPADRIIPTEEIKSRKEQCNKETQTESREQEQTINTQPLAMEQTNSGEPPSVETSLTKEEDSQAVAQIIEDLLQKCCRIPDRDTTAEENDNPNGEKISRFFGGGIEDDFELSGEAGLEDVLDLFNEQPEKYSKSAYLVKTDNAKQGTTRITRQGKKALRAKGDREQTTPQPPQTSTPGAPQRKRTSGPERRKRDTTLEEDTDISDSDIDIPTNRVNGDETPKNYIDADAEDPAYIEKILKEHEIIKKKYGVINIAEMIRRVRVTLHYSTGPNERRKYSVPTHERRRADKLLDIILLWAEATLKVARSTACQTETNEQNGPSAQNEGTKDDPSDTQDTCPTVDQTDKTEEEISTSIPEEANPQRPEVRESGEGENGETTGPQRRITKTTANSNGRGQVQQTTRNNAQYAPLKITIASSTTERTVEQIEGTTEEGWNTVNTRRRKNRTYFNQNLPVHDSRSGYEQGGNKRMGNPDTWQRRQHIAGSHIQRYMRQTFPRRNNQQRFKEIDRDQIKEHNQLPHTLRRSASITQHKTFAQAISQRSSFTLQTFFLERINTQRTRRDLIEQMAYSKLDKYILNTKMTNDGIQIVCSSPIFANAISREISNNFKLKYHLAISSTTHRC